MVLILHYLAELIEPQSVEDMEQPINLMVDLEVMVVLVADLYILKAQLVKVIRGKDFLVEHMVIL